MQKIVTVTIPGEPKAKARPRMNTRTGRAYTPGTTIQYENWTKACFINQGGTKLEGQVKATIHCYYSIAKSTSKKKREQMVQGIVRPTKKPDLDNVAKSILDSLNKIAYEDDSQVVSLCIDKYYSEEPRVVLFLEGEVEADEQGPEEKAR